MELVAKINNGIIKLPKKYNYLNNRTVKIFILEDENASDKKEMMKIALNEIIKRNIFKDIEDPVKWQRELRNEWE